MTTDTTADCETCRYGVLDENNPAKIMVYCKIEDRWRIYGSHLNCDKKEEKREK